MYLWDNLNNLIVYKFNWKCKRRETMELQFKSTHSSCTEVSGSFTGGLRKSRIGSALCAYEDHVHDFIS